MTEITAQHRLASYGTLAPGRVNHNKVSMIEGIWRTGIVRGWLSDDGWGATFGFPGLKLDPDGEAVTVDVLESPNLPGHWPRLDAFEGEEYERVIAIVESDDGPFKASIYVVKV
ncbi:MAG: gamma-glutamylcyclotransferase family protein [Pseudomonadota bacterium]